MLAKLSPSPAEVPTLTSELPHSLQDGGDTLSLLWICYFVVVLRLKVRGEPTKGKPESKLRDQLFFTNIFVTLALVMNKILASGFSSLSK